MKKAALSLQHLLAMFGATVLVPLLTGFDPSVAIFCAGVGTLIFHFCSEWKVPVFLGSSFALNLVDTTAASRANWFAIPSFRLPKFSLEAIFIIAPVVLATFMEHIGDITTNGTVVGKNFIEDPGLNKTLLGDGLATIFAGFVGGPANTTYGENTALLAITKNYDPRVLELTAVFAIILSCIGKFGGFLQSIPQAVMGGISIYLFSMITYVGVKSIRDIKCYKDNTKNVIIIATILIIGLGTSYLSTYAGINIGIPISKTSSLTGLSLAAIVGVILNRILNKDEFKNQEDFNLETINN